MDFETLKHSLLQPHAWRGTGPVEILETHISCVFLVGDKAYKVKKPVDLGFVDFSTLERRKHFCEEELRLNRRLAPEIYLRVVPICGSATDPLIEAEGEPIEFAVEMRRFSQDELLVHVEERGELTCEHVERLAKQVAEFHADIPTANRETTFGTPEQARQPIVENFSHLMHAALPQNMRDRLMRLKRWSDDEFERRREWFARRKNDGMIRECHGDMHLGNMILHNGKIVIFDCIEFNDNLRWVDVVSEVAFCTMDLEDRGQPDLAARFLNAYLEATGDYDGLWVLPYYLCYRAMVRAKVAWLRFQQASDSAIDRLPQELESYVALAERYAFHRRPGLLLMHGVSGTGKSFGGLKLVDALGAIRVRSDVERKRLADSALYSDEATQRTYERLQHVAFAGIQNGFVMLLDATFLKRAAREQMLEMALAVPVDVRILNLSASPETLRKRILGRRETGSDVSDADLKVLEQQLATQEPLSVGEREITIDVDTDAPVCWANAVAELRRIFGR